MKLDQGIHHEGHTNCLSTSSCMLRCHKNNIFYVRKKFWQIIYKGMHTYNNIVMFSTLGGGKTVYGLTETA